MKKVYLHIGHGKTGTSATQTALARLHEKLADAGVCYPEHPSFNAARDGKISSGNLDGTKQDWLEKQLLPAIEANPDYNTFVFSNENLFWQMNTLFTQIDSLRSLYSFHVILTVREPFEMLSSAYMQAVKRGGYVGSISDFAKSEGHINHAASLISDLNKLNISFSVINYSVEKNNITNRIFAEIGASQLLDSENKEKLGVINRSLTTSELQTVIFINQIFGAEKGAKVSDALVNFLPSVRSDILTLEGTESKIFSDRLKPSLRIVNNHLQKNERLSLKLPTNSVGDATRSLSSEQIQVVRDALDLRLLCDEDAPFLYAIASSYEVGKVINKDQAIMSLRLAARAKPSGPLIKAKLQELLEKPQS